MGPNWTITDSFAVAGLLVIAASILLWESGVASSWPTNYYWFSAVGAVPLLGTVVLIIRKAWTERKYPNFMIWIALFLVFNLMAIYAYYLCDRLHPRMNRKPSGDEQAG